MLYQETSLLKRWNRLVEIVVRVVGPSENDIASSADCYHHVRNCFLMLLFPENFSKQQQCWKHSFSTTSRGSRREYVAVTQQSAEFHVVDEMSPLLMNIISSE